MINQWPVATGINYLYAGRTISWIRQKQASVAILTTAAEIVAAGEAAHEIIWLNTLLTEMTVLTCTP